MDEIGITGHNFMDFDTHRSGRMTDMIHSELRALLHYWNELRGGREVPWRADIDPRAMSCDVRNLFILERTSPRGIRFRLVGTAIVDALGIELRGANARVIMAPLSRESFEALILRTLGDPGIGYARLHGVADDIGAWEMNLLPLASNSGAIDRIIGCLHPLTGVMPDIARQPVRFRIEDMNVEPIGAGTRDAEPPVTARGLAEAPGRFTPRAPIAGIKASPGFTTIDGDGQEGRGQEGRGQDGHGAARRGGHLRLVKK